MTTETNNNMIKNNENLVFVNCRKGDKITKIKPTQELTKNRGYRKTFSQKFIFFLLLLYTTFPIYSIKFLKD